MFDSIETIHGFDSAGRTNVDCLGYVLSSRFLWEDLAEFGEKQGPIGLWLRLQRLEKLDDVPSFNICLVFLKLVGET